MTWYVSLSIVAVTAVVFAVGSYLIDKYYD